MTDSTHSKPYHDADRLRELYHEDNLSIHQIADRFDCSPSTIHSWMERHDIETRGKNEPAVETVSYRTHQSHGYVELRSSDPDGVRRGCTVQQLLALAAGQVDGPDGHPGCEEEIGCDAPGVCPWNVFSDGRYQIHHLSGVEWDNRPENLAQVEHEAHYGHHLHGDDLADAEPVTAATERTAADGGTQAERPPSPFIQIAPDGDPHDEVVDSPLDQFDHYHPLTATLEKVCPWCGQVVRTADEVVTVDGRRGPPGHYPNSAVPALREYHPTCYDIREYVRHRVENHTLPEFDDV